MKYTYLKQWVNTCPLASNVVDKVHILNGLLQLSFVDRSILTFVYIENDCFPIYEIKQDKINSVSTWKQLENARYVETSISDSDRIIYFYFEEKDIYQQINRYCLVAECILPQPNFILTKVVDDNLIVLDALKKYTYADNPQRQILPNLEYQKPITSYKPLPESVPIPIVASDGSTHVDMNSYFVHHYRVELVLKQTLAKQQQLKQKWNKDYQKLQKKRKSQEQDLKNAENAQLWFTYSEIIKYNLQNIKQGSTELTTINYFSAEGLEITIPLLVDKSPLDNMKIYYKKYHKAKKGLQIIVENIKKTDAELHQIRVILSRIESGDMATLENLSISPTLRSPGALTKIEKLLKIKIDQDWEIVIGRKATENDMITTQLGRPTDWWFHTRIYHGSHILLRNFAKKEPDPELIRLCCALAAWYSKARFSENVPVDYTQIRFVRKPRKSAPGFVTYTQHNSFFAHPLDLRAVKNILGI
ncbi:MAG: hypothetical protein CVU48_10270 [Candidatus Cloacimonetes bacterium HGW-Cloacimonetes-1]|jgi:predicted ribosome quality control (RQC) complex YloA/Tae2 family protein|nr:MAG: hypothetical protein CVU48_10270 [Candidatus Cloacimonetes bacterium HGW-Cloacimonetes-1]